MKYLASVDFDLKSFARCLAFKIETGTSSFWTSRTKSAVPAGSGLIVLQIRWGHLHVQEGGGEWDNVPVNCNNSHHTLACLPLKSHQVAEPKPNLSVLDNYQAEEQPWNQQFSIIIPLFHGHTKTPASKIFALLSLLKVNFVFTKWDTFQM